MRKILKILGIIFLGVLVLSALLLFLKSKIWSNNFEATINQANIITSISESEDLFNEKVEAYILSEEDVDFIEFTSVEISQILYDSISNITNETSITLMKTYVIPDDTSWRICGLVQLNDSKMFKSWICADITKDNMQTAQLYIEKLLLNGINIGNIFPRILTQANQGIAEALVTVNENAFVGRLLENMELREDGIILKGSQY